jgi:hypothetical protein
VKAAAHLNTMRLGQRGSLVQQTAFLDTGEAIAHLVVSQSLAGSDCA